MSERASVLPFPMWLVFVDLLAGLCVVAGLLMDGDRFGSSLFPHGTRLLLLVVGALGIAGCSASVVRSILTTIAASQSRH